MSDSSSSHSVWSLCFPQLRIWIIEIHEATLFFRVWVNKLFLIIFSSLESQLLKYVVCG